MYRFFRSLMAAVLFTTALSPVMAQPVSFTVSSPGVVGSFTDSVGIATTTLSPFTTLVTVDYETRFALDMGDYKVNFGRRTTGTHYSQLFMERTLTLETPTGTFTDTSQLTSNVRYFSSGINYVDFFTAPSIHSGIFDLGSFGSLELEATYPGPGPFVNITQGPLFAYATLHRPSPNSIPEPRALGLLLPGFLILYRLRRSYFS